LRNVVPAFEPLVSVVIPAFNRAAYLGEAIDSALAQTYARTEIIVVDDGSHDQTADIAAAYGPRVTLVRQANAGAARARNAGMARAAGELIALLDSDDRWLPEKLALQVPLIEDPRIGLVYGGIRSFNTADGATLSEHIPREALGFHDLLAYPGLCTQTLLFRRRIVEEIGGFDPFFRTAEDWDWQIRVAARYALRGLPRIVADNRIHAGQISGDKDRLLWESLQIVKRQARTHADRPGGCDACRAAALSARRKIRTLHYQNLNFRARTAASRGRLLSAVGLGFRAWWQQPAALLRVRSKL
jgi:glycosyltransferase involved in cell wall biosynthesis